MTSMQLLEDIANRSDGEKELMEVHHAYSPHPPLPTPTTHFLTHPHHTLHRIPPSSQLPLNTLRVACRGV